jgi:hypothetical protein
MLNLPTTSMNARIFAQQRPVSTSQPQAFETLTRLVDDGAPVKHADRAHLRAMLSDGICLAAGVPLRTVTPGAERFERFDLAGIASWWARRWGVGRGSEKSILAMALLRPQQLGFDSVALSMGGADFSDILSDSISKTFGELVAGMPATSHTWTRQVLTDRLDQHDHVTIDPSLAVPEVALEGDEIESAIDDGDKKTSLNVRKFAEILAIDRETIINDDLGVLDPAKRWASTAASIDDDLVYAQVTSNPTMSDGVALFATAHANLTTGALTTASLSAATAALSNQTNAKSQKMNLRARWLVVPAALSQTAAALARDVEGGGNRLEVVYDARLDSDSVVEWYLVADTAQSESIVRFNLRDEPGPVIEAEPRPSFNADVLRWKFRYYAVAKATEHRGIVRSSGA